jgi:hypothetical protein
MRAGRRLDRVLNGRVVPLLLEKVVFVPVVRGLFAALTTTDGMAASLGKLGERPGRRQSESRDGQTVRKAAGRGKSSPHECAYTLCPARGIGTPA